MIRRIAYGLAALLAIACGVVAYYRWAPRVTPAGQPALVTLTEGNFETLRAAFNAASGSRRLVLLFSPT